MNEGLLEYVAEGGLKLLVKTDGTTVWLTQAQMCELFGRERSVITKHIRNVFNEGELNANSVCANFAQTATDGKVYNVAYYNLDVVISVGYRVKSLQGTNFRIWATTVLREYLVSGMAINNHYALASEMDRRLAAHDSQILELRKDVDYFIRSSTPPKEKVFVDGQMLDAQVELTRIVRTAKKRIVLIDNYIDERTLMLLGERGENVSCLVYTMKPNSPRLSPALENYAKEFPTKPIELKGYKKSHDRFLIVDDTIWHVGASLKDAGAALFALMKMELKPEVILSLL